MQASDIKGGGSVCVSVGLSLVILSEAGSVEHPHNLSALSSPVLYICCCKHTNMLQGTLQANCLPYYSPMKYVTVGFRTEQT
jgi:hypothetical protein